MSERQEIIDACTTYATERVQGRTIKSVRYMTQEEALAYGWESLPLVIELDNGALLFASMDDEGNGAGALFGQSSTGEVWGFPVISNYL